MSLWGKVVGGFFLILAAVFAVVAARVPEARAASLGIVAISLAVAVFGVPLVVRLFMSITVDEEVLESGFPGSATITALQRTRLRYNRYYPVVKFRLSVQRGGEPYLVTVRQTVEPDLLPQLAPGVVVTVRIDRTDPGKVAIDWRQPIAPPA